MIEAKSANPVTTSYEIQTAAVRDAKIKEYLFADDIPRGRSQ